MWGYPSWTTTSDSAVPVTGAPLLCTAIRAEVWGFGTRHSAGKGRGSRVAFANSIWIKQLDRAPLTLTRLTFESDNADPATTLRATSCAGTGAIRPSLRWWRHRRSTRYRRCQLSTSVRVAACSASIFFATDALGPDVPCPAASA